MNIKSINSKKRYSKKAASFILTLVLIFTTVFSNCMAINVNAAKKISLNNKKITVSVGSKKTIKVKNAPKKAKITFKTNKKKIATVTKKGVVKGIKQGKAKITVTVKYKSGKKNVSKKLTSQVLICPTSWEGGSDIVINEDMLYTSDTIHVACNRESLNRYMDVYAKAAGYSSIRLESPTHTSGIMHTATMAYYSDLLPVMNEHDIGWVPLGGLMELRNVHADEYPEANEGVKYHT